MNFKCISPDEFKQLQQGDHTLLDIRDPQSFQAGHIDGAVSAEQIDIEQFVEQEPKDKPLVICCYHGVSSQNAAGFFSEKGFTDVYSLNGGFEGWPG